MSRITDFYRGLSSDGKGRYLDDYEDRSQDWLEREHDFIQWMFPLPEPSRYNVCAPLLTKEDIEVFKTETHLRDYMLRMLSLMLRFYTESSHWIVERDHNHMRITRIIRSLTLIGAQAEAVDFLSQIDALIEDHGGFVALEAHDWWNDACNPNSSRFGRNILR